VDAHTTGINFQKKLKFNRLFATLGGDLHQISKDGTRTRNMIMTMNGLTTTSTKHDNLWNDAAITNAGLFGQFVYDIPSLHSSITGTLRYDYHQHFSADTFNLVKNDVVYFSKDIEKSQLFSYGLLYRWNITKNISAAIDLASAQRSPNMNELYIKRMGVSFDNYDYLGNPNLKPETNHQVTLNFRATVQSLTLGVNLFASQVEDYIGAVLLSPSIIMPATQGAPGVKQFANQGSARFYGGELVLNSSAKKRMEYGASAGYTYATLNHAIKYNIENNQVVSQEIIDNDPLPEIPAMSTTAWMLYKISKWHLIPQLNVEYTLPQRAVSKANYESSTPDYLLINANISYTFKTWATLNLGANNLLDKAYCNHLNRRVVSSNPAEKIKLYEPGRVIYVSLKIEL
jgi:iron complex outermembrane receptor protein